MSASTKFEFDAVKPFSDELATGQRGQVRTNQVLTFRKLRIRARGEDIGPCRQQLGGCLVTSRMLQAEEQRQCVGRVVVALRRKSEVLLKQQHKVLSAADQTVSTKLCAATQPAAHNYVLLLKQLWTQEVLLKQGKGRHLPSTTGDDDQLQHQKHHHNFSRLQTNYFRWLKSK